MFTASPRYPSFLYGNLGYSQVISGQGELGGEEDHINPQKGMVEASW